jgi:hypothetical protein
MQFPLPVTLIHALTYLSSTLTSTSMTHWRTLRSKVTKPTCLDKLIAQRWKSILDADWGSIHDKPSPVVVDAASKLLSIQRAIARASQVHTQRGPPHPTRITLHILPKRTGRKRKIHISVEPLRGSDASGATAAIRHILARSEPSRIKNGRRSTWVKEFLVRWEPETCTFGDVLEP